MAEIKSMKSLYQYADVTEREIEVLHLIAYEYTSKQIASKLYLSTETIHSHRKNLMFKLDVKNMAGLVRRGIEKGLITINH